MNKPNYKKIYAMKAEREKRIKKICPNIPHSSGIYAFHRTDEAGIRRSYVGQAVDLCERCSAHLAEYDHIALSLKKHGFYSEENPHGWKLAFKTCPKSELNEREVATIKSFADEGFQMYNITAGSQGKGKMVTGEYKQPKTYRQGIEAGKQSLAKELKGIIDKHLIVSIKPEKANNKISIKAFEKFNAILESESE